MKKVTEIVAELSLGAIEEQGCKLWDVEYVREAGQWYLRLLIDKDGGVDILDCDPIEGSYVFEVGSAGAERQLKRASDFEQFIGSPVLLKTYKAHDGRKEFAGDLVSYDNGDVTISVGGTEMKFEKAEVAMVRLRCEF